MLCYGLQNTSTTNDENNLYISAKTNSGIEALIKQLANRLQGDSPDDSHSRGSLQEQGDTPFLARSRHVVSLQQANKNIHSAQQQLSTDLELAAEDLRVAQQHLGEITGEFTPDDLLGKIFSEFCIGK